MKGINHAAVGVAIGVAAIQALPEADPLPLMLAAVVGSLLPDLDADNSMINGLLFTKGKHQRFIKMIASIALIAVDQIFFGTTPLSLAGAVIALSIVRFRTTRRLHVFKGIETIYHHRGPLHHPIIGALLFVYPLYLLNVSTAVIVTFSAGLFCGHYLLDLLTVDGLPFYPIKERIRVPYRMSSKNALMETFFVALIIAGIYVIN